MTTTMDFQTLSAAKHNVGTRTALQTTLRGTVQAAAVGERAQRLARLKAQIAAGTYFVPAGDVADSLMRCMLER